MDSARHSAVAMTNQRSMNIGITGLKNFGSTCYMNSVIQCLAGTLPFARYFLQGNWRRDAQLNGDDDNDPSEINGNSKHHNRFTNHFKFGKNGNSNNNQKLNTDVQVVKEFSRLVDHMWSGQYTSLSPTGFRAAVGALNSSFKSNEQQDCQEFASFLLNKLHETLNRVTVKAPSPAQLTEKEEFEFERLPDSIQAIKKWGQYMQRNWSIVTSIFQGQVQSRLRCLTCGQTSTTYSEFSELSVPIPVPPTTSNVANDRQFVVNTGRDLKYTLYQCLDQYVEQEILDGDDAWNCPRCRQKRRASKRLMISRLPLVLIIHLKRFLMHGMFRDKLESLVTFPIRNLDMTKYILPFVTEQLQPQQYPTTTTTTTVPTSDDNSNSTRYRLYAISNHYGTLTGGHYTANVFSGHRNEWNNFDDTRASRIQESQIVSLCCLSLVLCSYIIFPFRIVAAAAIYFYIPFPFLALFISTFVFYLFSFLSLDIICCINILKEY